MSCILIPHLSFPVLCPELCFPNQPRNQEEYRVTLYPGSSFEEILEKQSPCGMVCVSLRNLLGFGFFGVLFGLSLCVSVLSLLSELVHLTMV